MMDDAIKNVEKYWLNPRSSLALENKVDCQLDFSMTARALLFRCFRKTYGVAINNGVTNKNLFEFYSGNQIHNTMSGVLKR